MNKITLCLSLAFSLALSPTVLATEKNILIVKSMSVPIIDVHVGLFEKHLSQRAPEEMIDYRLTMINAEGDRQRLRSELGKLLKDNIPDLVVTSATLATQEVFSILKQRTGKTIPQVYFTVTDPWGAGVIDGKSPVSGVPYYLPSDIKMKIAQRLTRHKAGGSLNIGFVHSSYPSALSDLERVRNAATDTSVGFYPLQVDYRATDHHLDKMLEELKAKAREIDKVIDYWWLAKGPLGESPKTVDALAEVSQKPVLYGNGLAAVERGAIFYAAVSNEESMNIAAELTVDFLLERPFDPDRQAIMGQPYELFFNPEAAGVHGITIPSDLLDMALKNSGLIGR